jgi:GT2 family glycosyltransferase
VRDKLRDNLTALFQSEGDANFEIFVVDNNSCDGTVEMIKNDFPQVELIANKENLGFAKANNQAIKQAKGDFVLLLNPDMKVFPSTLISMVKWMKENSGAWVAGCNLVDEKGETIKHVRRFPTVWDQLAIILKFPHLFPSILKKYIREDFDYTKQAKVDSIRGGFFMIRNDIFKKIGLLDERYFVWFEEVDFCREVYKNKGEVWYTPAAKCVDYVGQSFKQLPVGKKQLYFRNSQLAYFKKWHPIWQFLILKIAWVAGMLLTNIGEKLNIKSISKT